MTAISTHKFTPFGCTAILVLYHAQIKKKPLENCNELQHLIWRLKHNNLLRYMYHHIDHLDHNLKYQQ